MACSGRESESKNVFSLSLLALAVHALLNPALAAAETSQDMVVSASPADSGESDKQNYAVQTTCAGTKLMLTPRDVPQSPT